MLCTGDSILQLRFVIVKRMARLTHRELHLSTPAHTPHAPLTVPEDKAAHETEVSLLYHQLCDLVSIGEWRTLPSGLRALNTAPSLVVCMPSMRTWAWSPSTCARK